MLRAQTGAPYSPVPQSAIIATRSAGRVPIGSGASGGGQPRLGSNLLPPGEDAADPAEDVVLVVLHLERALRLVRLR